MESAALTRALQQLLRRRGFDVVHPFRVAAYNRDVAEPAARAGNASIAVLEDFGRGGSESEGSASAGGHTGPSATMSSMSPSSLGCIVGCSRAVWPHFERWACGVPDADWTSLRDPFWDYVRCSVHDSIAGLPAAVSSSAPATGTVNATAVGGDARPPTAAAAAAPAPAGQLPRHRVYWSWQMGPGELVAMQRLADMAGLSRLDPASHLCLHPTFGPWHSLQCVVVFDTPFCSAEVVLGDGDSDGSGGASDSGLVPADEAATVQRLMARNLDPQQSTTWTDWLAVRNAYSLGKAQHRYSDAQIQYHYTHDRAMLERLRAGPRPLSVAAAQISAVYGDVAANLARHRAVVRAAVDAAVDVLVFPELSLTGYALEEAARLQLNVADGAGAGADGDPGAVAPLHALHAMAAEAGVLAVVGAPVAAEAAPSAAARTGGVATADPVSRGRGGGDREDSPNGVRSTAAPGGGEANGGKPLLAAVVVGGATGPVVYGKVQVHSSEAPFFQSGPGPVVVPLAPTRPAPPPPPAAMATTLRSAATGSNSTAAHRSQQKQQQQQPADAVGLAVCRDAKFAAHAQELARRGATVYACSALVEASAYDADVELLRSYVRDLDLPVVLANYASASGGLVPSGKSAVWVPPHRTGHRHHHQGTGDAVHDGRGHAVGDGGSGDGGGGGDSGDGPGAATDGVVAVAAAGGCEEVLVIARRRAGLWEGETVPLHLD